MKIKLVVLSIVRLFNRLVIALLGLVFILVIGLFIKPISLSKLEQYLKHTTFFLCNDFSYHSNGVFLGVHRFRLVVKLPKLEVFQNKKLIFKAEEVKVGIDFFESLFCKKIIPNCLIIRGSDFYYQASSDVKLQHGNVVANLQSNNHLFSVLFNRGEVEVSKVNIFYRQNDGSVSIFKDLSGKLKNDIWEHELRLEGESKFGKNNVFFEMGVRFIGDLVNLELEKCFGNLVVKNGVIDLQNNFFKQNVSDTNFPISSGVIKFSINNVKITNKLFKEPLVVNNFKTIVDWSLSKRCLKLLKLEFRDHFLSLLGYSKIIFDENNQPIADCVFNFDLKKIEQAYRYYPRAIMGVELLDWLDNAFKKGEILDGNMILRGNLKKFPFDNQEGIFKIDAIVNKVDLLYQDGWPMLTNLKANLHFKNCSMEVIALNGKLLGESVKSLTAKIDDLEYSLLKINGQIETDSKVGLNFIYSSPLRSNIGKSLKDIVLKGPMNLKLILEIPLADEISDQITHFDGNLVFKENNLSIKRTSLSIENIKGEVNFSENELTSQYLNGVIMNFPANLLISTLSDGKVKIDIRSMVDILALERYLKVKLPFLSGSFAYNIDILVPKEGESIFCLESNLHGISCNLPEPFSKKMGVITPVQVKLIPQQKDNYLLHVNWNDLLTARLDLVNNRDFEIKSGEIVYGKTQDLLTEGNFIFKGNFEDIDLDQWEQCWLNYGEKKRVFDKNFGINILVDNLLLKAKKIKFRNLVLTNALVGIENCSNGYQFTVTSNELKGSVFFPKEFSGTLKGDLFYWRDFIQSGSTDDFNVHNVSARIFPWSKFDLFIEEFIQDKHKINRIFLKGTKEKLALEFKHFALGYDGILIDGTGRWQNNNLWLLEGKAVVNDLGKVLNKFTSHCYGGEGGIYFSLSRFYKDKRDKLQGKFLVDLKKGGIINLSKHLEEKLNLGKIINALDVGLLAKNVGLDFKDYRNGYWYDNIGGEILLDDQYLFFNNFRSSSNPADIKIKGKLNWKSLTFDLFLSIFPKLTGSVPVVAGVAGGPVVGAIALVANQVVNKVVGVALEYRYHLLGSLDNFSINKL